MSVYVNPQEIYLLERFSSLEYFGTLRDAWAEMVANVEASLSKLMQNLPADYRSRPLPEQPDVAWGQRVLPNFQETLRGLNTGFILLSHGDAKGLRWAHGPQADFKGQLDYSTDWMSKSDQNLYHSLLLKATTMAGNITATEGAYWLPLELSNFSEQRGPLDPPAAWPAYTVNGAVAIRTGSKTTQTGIYVPDVENSCAEFLSTSHEEAPMASVLVGIEDLLHPVTSEKYGERPVFKKVGCTWRLVERTSGVITNEGNSRACSRVAGGDQCPETGFYFTPARPGSRSKFEKGEVMPAYSADYGTTIWQWDTDQA
jgi:hypothetical protein